ncbi:DUF2279 domain-containing protein [Indioceanicola profundi]|uniref:DUF2279 domain-containing protein n=1 Tax=Indioceanicola profundi TaxID=2220096 RepID=UPI000E6ACDFD|nr:DUF2279 domain-containing protein [Indioceanicola profundi]
MPLLIRLFSIVALLICMTGPAAALWDEEWSKERKAFHLNVGAGASVLAWGAFAWDWGSGGPRFQDEGWFSRTTTEGGADKLGHGWSGYALGHLFSRQYEQWGFTQREAARYGAFSSIGIMGLVELGDSISDDYGFSYQDMLFNVAGAALGYVLWDYPDLARKIDFRAEYDPFRGGPFQTDVFTDYERLKYLLAIKAEGFDAIQNPALRSLELHLGFYARGYRDYDQFQPEQDERRRHVYVGIGLNVTRLLGARADVGRVFNYIQVPYTYVSHGWNVDR